jgi:hypothetical protein
MPLSVCRIDRGCCRRHRPARDETLRACNAGRWHSRCRVFRMEASASHRSADRRDGTAATFARNRLLQLLMARVVPGREGGPIPGRPFSTGPAAAAEPRADNPRASTQAGRADPAPPPAASRLAPSQPGQAGLPRSLWSAQVAGIRAPDVGIRMLGYPPMELPVVRETICANAHRKYRFRTPNSPLQDPLRRGLPLYGGCGSPCDGFARKPRELCSTSNIIPDARASSADDRIVRRQPARDVCGLDRVLQGSRQPMGQRKKIMRTLLEHDSVALAVLVIGIAAVELLALSF